MDEVDNILSSKDYRLSQDLESRLKNTGKNGKQKTSKKNEMNWQIKQLQNNLDSNKKLLAYLPYGNDSDNNSVHPSDLIKGKKAKKKNSRNE